MPKEHAPEPSGWITARRYPDPQSALLIYESARDALLIDKDLDASVLRFTLGGVSHIAVLSERPLDAEQSQLVSLALADSGEPAELPPDLIEQLLFRRRRATSLGFDYIERQTKPD